MKLRFDSIKGNSADIIDRIVGSEDNPFSGTELLKFRLCVEEAVDNIVNYAYGEKDGWIEAELTVGQWAASLVLKDSGTSFNPLEASEPVIDCPVNDRKIGGLGIHLIKNIMDDVQYQRADGCNILTMTKQLDCSPLSQAQAGIWYACQDKDRTDSNYQIPFLYFLPDNIDLDKLKNGLDAFVKAHPYICSRISLCDGEPVMNKGKVEEVIIRDTENINDPSLAFGKPIDLLNDPLYRIEIYRTSEGNYLFCDFHHIIFDGSSFNAFKEDLKAAYLGEKIQNESIDGAGAAIREFQKRNSEEFKLEKEWYSKEFAAASDCDSKPSPSNILTSDKGRIEKDFTLKLKDDCIKAVCSRFNVRKSTVVTAAWAKTLANFTAENKASFATIHHGRNDKDCARTVSMMVRTLPVYSEMPSERPVSDWLSALEEQMDKTREKSAYSFSDAHSDLSLSADIIFAYQGHLASHADFPIELGDTTITCRDLRKPIPGAVLDAQLFAVSNGGSDYLLRIGYDTATYSDFLVQSISDSYCQILQSMASAETIGDIEASSEGQLKWLDSQNPAEELPQYEGLIERFRKQACLHPDNICCVAGQKSYTYKEIDEISDHLATYIRNSAKFKDDESPKAVSFICPRNEWMVIIPLAILKAGFSYQPLDSSYPVERLSFMARDSHAGLLVCTAEFSPMVSDQLLPRLIVSSPDELRQGNAPRPVQCQPDDIAVLLYTSGTTGTPKGVMVTHRNLDAIARFNRKCMTIGPDSRYASYASYGFDAYQLDLWSSMTAGAAIHIIGDDIRFDLEGIYQYFLKNKISQAIFTTQVGTQMAINYPDIPSMQAIGVGGEKLVSFIPPKYHFFNMYGPTENAVYISCHDHTIDEKNIPIGRPTETTRLYVVNKDGKRVPPCAAGELLASGPQVAAGYLRQPEKTAAAFIPNRFYDPSVDDCSYSRAYRTGDIVRYREDGEIEFIGRKDGQVKVRGFRIELKEVEAVIREFPGIKEVTVQAFDLEDGGKAIAAYIVAGDAIDIQALNDFIGKQKPPYMVPAATMQIDAIPMTVNGKVDKKKLPEPQMGAAPAKTGNAAPLNKLEEAIMELVSRQTGSSDFDITTPLSYAGLSSISSMKLSAQIFKAFGVQISAADLTHGASIQSIENLILESLLTRKENAEPQTKEKEIAAPPGHSATLTNAQSGVYYECMKNSGATVYNIPVLVSFPEDCSAEDIAGAVRKVIAAHPVLMSVFDNSVNPPVIAVKEGTVPLVEVSDKDAEELKKQFVKPFDLSKGPLYRATVCGSKLLLDAHHLVMDGVSMDIFIRQICACLEGKEINPESFSFFDHAAVEAAADYSEAAEFFEKELKEVEESSTLPADLHGKEEEGHPGVAFRTVNHESISEFARRLCITPAAVYLAAMQYLTARYCNTKASCICTVSSGRSDSRIADSVGMFVNTLAIASKLEDESVRDYLLRTADNFFKVLKNEQYPFSKVADKFGLGADTMFVYELGVINPLCVRGKSVTTNSLEISAPKCKFTLLVEQRGADICLTAEYNDALYSKAMVGRFLESLVSVLDNMISEPDKSLLNLSIISPGQQKELDWMNYGGDMDRPVRLVHKGMERWAQNTPDKIAVIAKDATLTYREFDREANRIANELLSLGLKREDAVVVLLPRRSSTLTCIFGILKAGGAYIPCDPEYPSERIKLIAEDSGAPFVVTTRELVGNYGSRGICIDELTSGSDCSNPELDIKKENLAYYIYTSGSTGKPKGVAVEHGNITTVFNAGPGNGNYPFGGVAERLCGVFTISFDAFTMEFGMSMFHGRTFIFSDEVQAKDPVALSALMKETDADYIGGTGSRLLQYLELPEFVECIKKCKVIVQGGEKYPEMLLTKLRELNPSAVLLNGYGPTEISISCNAIDLQKEEYISVGRPQQNYYEWILDKDGNELPVGVTGELCVGGDGVTRGYKNLPEKTAEKYITFRGLRAFKTGDYARWHEDGKVEILGRTDNQVKLRGLRIELGEVESVIGKVEGIKNVLARISNIQGRDHLAAYFTADREVEIGKLKKTISSTLTSYMVPDAYLQLDSFPMTPNGKIDFRHLPEPVLVKSERTFEAPANDTEKFFADCFASVLGIENVGATDSFFELGGTSLVVMKVVINAQKAGYQLTYPDVFANPSPRQLAALLGKGDIIQKDPDADISGFDYSGIDAVIKENTLDTFLSDQSRRKLGNVLLTGATGFLGIHILKCLLEESDCKIYCLLRSKKGISAEQRLKQMAFYYFEKDISELIGKQLFIFEGDVTAPIETSEHIDTVFNCAALVKHFAKGNEIEDINVGGVRSCIDFCLKQRARLIQISTYSVGGMAVNGFPDIKAFDETMLWKGQRIRNQYVHSKIMGERLILDAVATKGLDAKIMRVGNLSARTADGEFQINVKANSFMGRIKIYQMLGAMPYQAFGSTIEFSPIDQTARAICLLAGANSSCTIFHPYNNHIQLLGDVLNEMCTIGKEIKMVESIEFSELLQKAKEDKNTQEELSAMLAYETRSSGESVSVISPANDFTVQVLLRLGFRWSQTSWDYVDKFLRQINSLNFFEKD